jgi:cytochrome c biogenesis protein CcmG/thiol:disulfide interchange protein DsbE
MKKIICFALLILSASALLAQAPAKLPSATVKTLGGKKVNMADIQNDGKPIVIIFWATWCHHTIDGMDEIAEYFDDWVDETGVKIIAVSTDDTRSLNKVGPMVNVKGWEYDFYTDENGQFQRQMNVTSAPFVIVLDGNMTSIWQKQGFAIGDSELILSQITKALEDE